MDAFRVFAWVQAVLAALVAVAILWALRRARIAIDRRISETVTRRLKEVTTGDAEFVRRSHIVEALQLPAAVAMWGLALFVMYVWVTFTLRRFPETLPWGDALRAFLAGRLLTVGIAIWRVIPDMFMVAVIAVLTGFVVRVVHLLFQAVEDGRIINARIHRETAEPTRRILAAALWLFALVLAFPYLPGSDSDAFRGVSVFVGLVLSLGSSGLLNHMVSGLTLVYSRAVRLGEFVSIGGVMGTVTDLGMISTKVRTAAGEDVTIPNAVVVSTTVTNYSRLADEGVFVSTQVTIGYDAPWRQVHALLLRAAARTAGIRLEPAPRVRQSALEDPYVRYTLLFTLERPVERLAVLSAVHANIQDAFNEYGVQIMSPVYENDPAGPKVVPKERWYSAPAGPDAAETPLTNS
jgi:small-conductance mechanosensitive channel